MFTTYMHQSNNPVNVAVRSRKTCLQLRCLTVSVITGKHMINAFFHSWIPFTLSWIQYQILFQLTPAKNLLCKINPPMAQEQMLLAITGMVMIHVTMQQRKLHKW